MSVEMKDVRKAFHDWAALVTGRKVRWANAPAGRPPNEPYVSLNFIGVQPVGYPGHTYVNQDPADGIDLDETVRQTSTIQLSVNVIDESAPGEALDAMMTLIASPKRFESAEIFYTGKVGFARASAPRNLTTERQGKRETRFQADLYFHCTWEIANVLLTIQKVTIRDDISGRDIVVEETNP